MNDRSYALAVRARWLALRRGRASPQPAGSQPAASPAGTGSFVVASPGQRHERHVTPGAGPDVYAGGNFTTAGGVAANSSPGTARLAPRRGMSQQISPGGSAPLYAATSLRGGVAPTHRSLGRHAWHPRQRMNAGLALAFAGRLALRRGQLHHSRRVAANRIARWDGATSAWHPLGSGMGGGYHTGVYALALGRTAPSTPGGLHLSRRGRSQPHRPLGPGDFVLASLFGQRDGGGSGLRPGGWAGWLTLRRRRLHRSRRGGSQPHRPLGPGDFVVASPGQRHEQYWVGPPWRLGRMARSTPAAPSPRPAGSQPTHRPLGHGDFVVASPGQRNENYVFALAFGPTARSTPGATSPQPAGSQPTTSPAGTWRVRHGIPWAAGWEEISPMSSPWRLGRMAHSTPGATSPQPAGSQPTASPAGTWRLRRGIP